MANLKNDYKAQQEILRMETQAMFPYLIEVTVGNEVLRYVNADEDVTFEGSKFTASYFKLSPPERTQTGIKDASITISAIDGEWIARIRQVQTRSTIRFIAVIMYENGTQVVEPIDDITFKLTNASWNDTTIQWTMKFDDLLDVNMPCVKFSEDVCPALY